MDVVFNHTAEGNDKGLTLSFRGIDNSVFYMLAPKVNSRLFLPLALCPSYSGTRCWTIYFINTEG